MIKVVHWKFHNLTVPMLRIDGQLYTTSHVLSITLGVAPKNLDMIFNSNREEFDGLRANNLGATNIEFLLRHKGIFGVTRLRSDVHIWSEDDMLSLGFAVRSSMGKEFRKSLKDLIKKHAVIEIPTVQENQRLLEQLRLVQADNALMNERLSAMEEMFSWAKPQLQKAASAAGTTLQAQKGTKELREIN